MGRGNSRWLTVDQFWLTKKSKHGSFSCVGKETQTLCQRANDGWKCGETGHGGGAMHGGTLVGCLSSRISPLISL
jgi:hypothetical protein